MSHRDPTGLELALRILEGDLAVCRLPPGADVPPWAVAASFFSVTRTAEEMSVVCPAGAVPEGVPSEGPFRALKVRGPLDFGLTGVLAALTAPLARAGVPVFALSTFDTDYLLISGEHWSRALDVCRAEGWMEDGP